MVALEELQERRLRSGGALDAAERQGLDAMFDLLQPSVNSSRAETPPLPSVENWTEPMP